jgi:cytochrome P450
MPPGSRLPRTVQTAHWYAIPYGFFEFCRRRYGATFTTRLLSVPPTAVLSRPDDVKGMFTADPTSVHPGEGMRLIEPLVGATSVILLDESHHLRQRKLLLPAFHRERLQDIVAALDEVVARDVATWPTARPISVQERARHLTLDVILRTAMGLEPGERLNGFRDAIARFLDLGLRPTASLPRLRRNLGPFGAWPRFAEARERLDALIFGLIDERGAADDAARSRQDDVLELLLGARDEHGAPMSSQEVRDELLTLLVAGHETTATALAWTFERLAVHERARRELVSRLDVGEAEEYASAIAYESLRQRPVLPEIGLRVVKEEVLIGDRTYGPGCGLTASAYLLHHDSTLYPDPHAFRPERFLDERPGTYTWIPFGGGIRRCLGSALALAEMEAVLRHVFTRFEVHFARTRPLRPVRRNITVGPRGGVEMTLAARRAVPRGTGASAAAA